MPPKTGPSVGLGDVQNPDPGSLSPSALSRVSWPGSIRWRQSAAFKILGTIAERKGSVGVG